MGIICEAGGEGVKKIKGIEMVKKYLLLLVLIFCFVFFQNSSSGKGNNIATNGEVGAIKLNRFYTALQIGDSVTFAGIVKDTSDFIEFADGKILKKPVYVSGAKTGLGGNKLFLSDGEKYRFSDIKSYSTKGRRYYNCRNNWFGAMVKEGKIKAFGCLEINLEPTVKMLKNSRLDVYIQKGNGEIFSLNTKILRDMVSDNPTAVAHVDKYISLTEKKAKYLEMAIDTYNGLVYGVDEYYDY
ncbi:MAG: hypothetical protein WCI49_03100 [Ferruginibacter sp.]